jgi:glutaminyl-tRNA synthetase
VLREADFANPSRQIEFARLNLNYCLTSKRKNLRLVNEGIVSGWDDPRLVTIRGMRRRGFPAEALRAFVDKAGMSKTYSVIDYAMLEYCVRDALNHEAPRAMAVLRPLRVTIENYPEGRTEQVEVDINPEQPELGRRAMTFSRNLYIEADDFLMTPVKGWHRLSPGAEVRFKGAYFLTCKEVITDAEGKPTELICTYDPATKGGDSPDGRKVKGTIHWVSADDCVTAEVRLYDRLFRVSNPSDGELLDNLNPDSLEVIRDAKVERYLATPEVGARFQFLRLGYFAADPDGAPERPVFNRTVTLKDSWAKQAR